MTKLSVVAVTKTRSCFFSSFFHIIQTIIHAQYQKRIGGGAEIQSEANRSQTVHSSYYPFVLTLLLYLSLLVNECSSVFRSIELLTSITLMSN